MGGTEAVNRRVNQERRHLVIDMSDGVHLTLLICIKQL